MEECISVEEVGLAEAELIHGLGALHLHWFLSPCPFLGGLAMWQRR